MTSSTWFHDAPWLDFNMCQSGHARRDDPGIWTMVEGDYRRAPAKPAVNGEPNYENHPVNWNWREGWFSDYDVRKAAFLSLFSGAFGHTYGTWSEWQIQRPFVADNLPGLAQMQFVRALMESRPFLSRVPDQGLIVDQAPGSSPVEARATRDANGSCAMVYLPGGRHRVTVDTGRLSGTVLNAWWYRPTDGGLCAQDGKATGEPFTQVPVGGSAAFESPAEPGPDWVLVLDDASEDFAPPGKTT
jgi:hypothetical protein